MKRWKGFLTSTLAGAALGAALAFPAVSVRAASEALSAFARTVLPSLLPTFFLMLLFSSRVPTRGALLVPMAWLCGSPGGARLAAGAARDKACARRLCAMTGTMSPGFFLGTLGALTGSPSAARGMLLCHLAAALLAGLCFRGKSKQSIAPPAPVSVFEAAGETARVMLLVGVIMTVGAVVSALAALLPLPEYALTAAFCLIEITSGALRLCALPSPLRYPLLCAACSFGGLSVILQTAAYWKQAGLTVKDIAAIRALHALLSFLLCFFAFSVFVP